MYYLYIDESGDSGDYLDKNKKVIEGSSKFFTLAGIIVNDNEKDRLDNIVRLTIDKYFNQMQLPKKFKLHYHPLRNKRYPYDQLSNEQRKQLADNVFGIIKESECVLLSVTINLEHHCVRYEEKAADPRAYSMLIILERFQDFLEERNEEGIAIYEKFNHQLRRKVDYTMTWLRDALHHRHYKELDNIKGPVKNGDPEKEPILQLSDFFAYATWIRSKTSGKSEDRWQSIKDKYFRLYDGWYRAGNVEI